MKQVTYNIDWLTLAGALIATHDVEDGFWQLNIRTESVTGIMPAPLDGANPMAIPGHMVRITGLQLTKVPNLDFMSYQVKNGQIVEIGNGLNSNNSGSDSGGEGSGENSREAGSDISGA